MRTRQHLLEMLRNGRRDNGDDYDIRQKFEMEYILNNLNLLQFDPYYINPYTDETYEEMYEEGDQQIIDKLFSYWDGDKVDNFILPSQTANELFYNMLRNRNDSNKNTILLQRHKMKHNPKKYKNELMEEQAKMMYHPDRVTRLLKSRQLGNDLFDKDLLDRWNIEDEDKKSK